MVSRIWVEYKILNFIIAEQLFNTFVGINLIIRFKITFF